jgi:hypothetical protein
MSPTLDDVIYKEYPHLSKPINYDVHVTTNEGTEIIQCAGGNHVTQYWHTSNQPFQEITSLRAHFVQSFDDPNSNILDGGNQQQGVRVFSSQSAAGSSAFFARRYGGYTDKDSQEYNNTLDRDTQPDSWTDNECSHVQCLDQESGCEILSSDFRSLTDTSDIGAYNDLMSKESGVDESTCDDKSERTLEGDHLSFDSTFSDEMHESPLKRRKDKLTILAKNVIAETQVEVLMSTVSQVAKDIKDEVKEMKPDLTPTPDSKELPTPLMELKQYMESTDQQYLAHSKQLIIEEQDFPDDFSSNVTKWVRPVIDAKCLDNLKCLFVPKSTESTVPQASIVTETHVKFQEPEQTIKIQETEEMDMKTRSLKNVTECLYLETDQYYSETNRQSPSSSDDLEDSSGMSYSLASPTKQMISSSAKSLIAASPIVAIPSDTSIQVATSTSPVSSSHDQQTEQSSSRTTQNEYSDSQSSKSPEQLSPPLKSPVSVLKSTSPDISTQSLPSSPKRLVHSNSNGVKKITSELFSSATDLSRSLEIVYKEPEEDPKRKLSSQYRTESPNNSAENVNKKLEKRKASFTQLRKYSDYETSIYKSQQSCPGGFSDNIETESNSADFTPYVTVIHPPHKKPPSPTKVSLPKSPSSPNHQQVSEEKISPILEVKCKTPERSPQRKFQYVKGNERQIMGTCFT